MVRSKRPPCLPPFYNGVSDMWRKLRKLIDLMNVTVNVRYTLYSTRICVLPSRCCDVRRRRRIRSQIASQQYSSFGGNLGYKAHSATPVTSRSLSCSRVDHSDAEHSHRYWTFHLELHSEFRREPKRRARPHTVSVYAFWRRGHVGNKC